MDIYRRDSKILKRKQRLYRGDRSAKDNDSGATGSKRIDGGFHPVHESDWRYDRSFSATTQRLAGALGVNSRDEKTSHARQ